MNPGLIVKLRPSGPWRIGPDSGARNRVDVIYHSDSLYSAITSAMARLGWLEDWLDATARTASPVVSFGSCFPYMDQVGFVVPPRTVWPPASSSTRAARVRWKSARFVPLTVVQSILAGKRLDENQWSVDGPSDCLVPNGSAGPFRTAVRWNAGVDRLTGVAERHSTACIEFRTGAGLWTVVSFQDETAQTRWAVPVKAAFRLLADTGFGGERSRGWGRSEAPEFTGGMLPDLILPSLGKNPEPIGAATVRERSQVSSLIVEPEVVAEPAAPVAEPETHEAPAIAARPAESPAVAEPELEAVAPVIPVEPLPVQPLTAEAPVVEMAAPLTMEPEPSAVESKNPELGAATVRERSPVSSLIVEPEVVAEPVAPLAEPVALEPPVIEARPAEPGAGAEPELETIATVIPAEPVPAEPLGAEPVAPEEPSAEAAPAPLAAPPAETLAEVPRTEPVSEPPVTQPHSPTHPHWLLSVFTPAAADTVDWSRGNYTVLARGGRVDSPAGSGGLKKQLQMVAEGSVIYAEAAPRGSAADVAPDGFAHPVFRAGFALAIPLPEVI
jgi:CRISPR type III-A-associated RAMP protein Csm4